MYSHDETDRGACRRQQDHIHEAIKRAHNVGVMAIEDAPGGRHVIVNRRIGVVTGPAAEPKDARATFGTPEKRKVPWRESGK